MCTSSDRDKNSCKVWKYPVKTEGVVFTGYPVSIYRGTYMSAHVLLNLLNELKEIKCEACRAFYLFFATSLINSIIQEHEC